MSDPDAAEFDPAAIALLRRVGDDVLVARMAEMFTSNAAARIETMKTSLASGDIDSVVRTAHSLKSSAGQLGAARLQTLLASIEADARNNADPGKIQRAIEDAGDAVVRAIAWLDGQTRTQ